MRQACDVLIPDLSERLIGRADPTGPDYPADQLPFPVIEEHPVTLELPADGRPGGINAANKSFAVLIPAEERTWFFLTRYDPGAIGVPVRDLVSIFSIRVDREHVSAQAVPAVVVTVIQLALYPDERSIPGATFPAAIADKFCHTVIVS
jgi:hypothetical protein